MPRRKMPRCRQIVYEITGQKRPNNFQDEFYNDQFKMALLKFMASTWGEEKYVTILQNKELRVIVKISAFSIV